MDRKAAPCLDTQLHPSGTNPDTLTVWDAEKSCPTREWQPNPDPIAPQGRRSTQDTRIAYKRKSSPGAEEEYTTRDWFRQHLGSVGLVSRALESGALSSDESRLKKERARSGERQFSCGWYLSAGCMGAGIGEPECICRTGSFLHHLFPEAAMEGQLHGPEASQGFQKLF